MVVKYMHHGDDLVEHRTREASFGAQCTNHSANKRHLVVINFFYFATLALSMKNFFWLFIFLLTKFSSFMFEVVSNGEFSDLKFVQFD